MESLMSFEEVSELLNLDSRDEGRNKILFGAVCEKICLYLDRNLLFSTKTETKKTFNLIFDFDEFPVRELLELVDADTGENLSLSPETPLRDISRPDAHKYRVYQIDSPKDRNVRATYRYGYSLEEMPMLIKAKIVEMTKIWIAFSVTDPIEEIEKCWVNRLDEINVYRRVNRL